MLGVWLIYKSSNARRTFFFFFKVHRNPFDLQTGAAHLGWIMTHELKHSCGSGSLHSSIVCLSVIQHPAHECYFLWAQCDHDSQVRIKMSALRNVTELELKRFIDLNRFNVPESKLCFLNPLPLIVTRLGCVSNGNLLQCFSLFKNIWRTFESKKNSLKEKPTLASLSANMSSLIWLFICKVYLTWHLTIDFPVPSTDLEKETELEAWKSPLHCMKDGENTLGRFVPFQINSQEFMWFSSLSD